eukprot:4493197-Pyramimonas_sp.AAC.1
MFSQLLLRKRFTIRERRKAQCLQLGGKTQAQGVVDSSVQALCQASDTSVEFRRLAGGSGKGICAVSPNIFCNSAT